MKPYSSLAAVALGCAIAACDSEASARTTVARTLTDSARSDSIARARQDSVNRAQPGYVVDSIFPVEEQLRRFRDKIGGTPATTFSDASTSRDALIKRIVKDVAQQDTTDMRSALISAREFADLIYPSSPNFRPPYQQAPDIVWMMIQNRSQSGYLRVVRRRGEAALRLQRSECKEQPEVQGENKLWTDCVVHLVSARGDTSTQKWFGTIVERDGRFKLLSYRNQF